MTISTVEKSIDWQVGRTTAPLPPRIKSLPFIGIALKLGNNPLEYFVQLYKQYGAIFRTNILNRHITVMGGLEANRFLNTTGNEILDSTELFGSFGHEFNTDTFLTAIDGPEHMHLRKQARRGYSRSAIMPHMKQLLDIVDQYTETLKAGDTIPVLSTLQYLVTQQLGIVIAGRTPDDYFPYLQRFLNYNINVKVMKMWPEFMMHMPAYKEAKKKVIQLGKEVLATHRADEDPVHHDLIHDLLQTTGYDGQPLDENALLAATIGPYFAGIDTVAASLSFLMYNVLKYPHVKEGVIAEADGIFIEETPSLTALKDMEMLHGAAIENLRMYPVAPFTPRITKEPFEFADYRVDAGTEIFFAQTITHYLEKFYPDPYTFDPMRFAKGQGKGTAGAFAPYTLGAHLCLGAGIAEAQMMLIMARLMHNLELELETPDYEVTIHATPLPNPGRDFVVRVIKNRM